MIDVSLPSTLAELFGAARPPDPATPLLHLPGGEQLSYGAMDKEASQIASVLAANGVEPGERVAAQIEKSPRTLALYLACLRLGAVLLPMNAAYTADEVAYLLGDATPRLVVADPAAPAAKAALPALTLTAAGTGELADAASSMPDHFDQVALGPSDPAVLLYTSGTTGRPKGALLSQQNLAANAAALIAAWGFTSADVLVHSLPMFHIHGLLVATNCALGSGAQMRYLSRFEPNAVLDELPRATVMMGVPTYYHRLLASPRLDRELCAPLRLFISGSAPLPLGTFAEFEERTGHRIVERYGTTESSIVTSSPLEGERRPGTVGFALSGVEVRIVDDESAKPLEPGAIGGVEVRGPSVFSGYLGRDELNETEFRPDGFFRTGDLGRVDADGYLSIVGRAKDLIISGGLNVYPKEVEEVLDALAGVAESAVIGLPDDDFGEVVVALVVPVGDEVLEEASLRAACRERLAPFKVPKRLLFVGELPRNSMGKVEKARLREELGADQRER